MSTRWNDGNALMRPLLGIAVIDPARDHAVKH
jgi:hypothetical protein